MATTLLDQWTAAFGPIAASGKPPPVSADSEPATAFRRRCIIAAINAAISVGQENPGTTQDHANRAALAKAVMNEPLAWVDAFSAAAAAQGIDNTSLDQPIKDAIWGIWSTMAGAL